MADDPSESRSSEYEFPELPDAGSPEVVNQGAQALGQQPGIAAMEEELVPINEGALLVRLWFDSIVFSFTMVELRFAFRSPPTTD